MYLLVPPWEGKTDKKKVILLKRLDTQRDMAGMAAPLTLEHKKIKIKK